MIRLPTSDRRTDYFDAIVQAGLWPSQTSLQRYSSCLFQGVDTFQGKTVLDVGGGCGVFSFYAAARGAKQVVCLEPEAAGSNAGMHARFHELAKTLETPNVTLVTEELQSFAANGRLFDVVLLNNSINHLDEPACVALRVDEQAREKYRRVFRKLRALTGDHADLILADCSPHNLFPQLGLKNPFYRSIEWHKHQPPQVWAELLTEFGFATSAVRWTSYNRLGRIGWLVLSNPLASYVLRSHFVLHMRKQRVAAVTSPTDVSAITEASAIHRGSRS